MIVEPSFLALLDRSKYKYLRTRKVESRPLSKNEIVQRERFCVAALAFCLFHSPSFRVKFAQKVCDLRIHNPEDIEIQIEPRNQADLLLRATRIGTVCVVEFKVHAPTKAKQMAGNKEFHGPKGYGKWLLNEFPESKRIFVNLDQNEHLSDDSKIEKGIRRLKRNWHDVRLAIDESGGSDPSSLLSDLRSSLYRLEINAMKKELDLSGYSANAKNILEACRFTQILKTIQGEFGFTDPVDTWMDAEGGYELGVGVKKRESLSAIKGIQQKRRNHWLLWFGWSEDKPLSLGVWIRFESDKFSKQLHKDLNRKVKNVALHPEDAKTIIIRKAPDDMKSDLDWLRFVFKALGLKQSPENKG